MYSAVPPKQGLYDPQFEHDSCGVGFVVDIAGRKSNQIVRKSLQVLMNLQHRGAKGCEAAGAGKLRRWNGFPSAGCVFGTLVRRNHRSGHRAGRTETAGMADRAHKQCPDR